MDRDKTMAYEEPKELYHTLIVFDCRCVPMVYQLDKKLSFGRLHDGKLCDITVQSSITGRSHGEFILEPNGSPAYRDLNSLNGTYINGRRLKPYDESGSYPYKLHNGDILRVDNKNPDSPHNEAVIMLYRTDAVFDVGFRLFDTAGLVNVTIGTDRNCVVRLSDTSAEKNHAVLRHSNGKWSLFNNRGDTTVNGQRVDESAVVYPHDVLRLGNTIMVIYGNILIYGAPKFEV